MPALCGLGGIVLAAVVTGGPGDAAGPESEGSLALEGAASSTVVLPTPLIQPLDAHVRTAPSGTPPALLSDSTIPAVVRQAYSAAAVRVNGRRPACHLDPSLLAGIGFIESGHAHGHGSESAAWDGVARPPILGPVLAGNGFAAIADTDRGRFDGDDRWDRAVGPMQFIPSTWRRWGVDADGDGRRDPQDVRDATAGAAEYLCADGRDLQRPADLAAAVFAYNHSSDYVRSVLQAAVRYGADVAVLSAASGMVPATSTQPAAPPSIATSSPPAAVVTPPARPTAPRSPAPSPSPRPSVSPTPAPAPSSVPPSSPTEPSPDDTPFEP